MKDLNQMSRQEIYDALCPFENPVEYLGIRLNTTANLRGRLAYHLSSEEDKSDAIDIQHYCSSRCVNRVVINKITKQHVTTSKRDR